VSRDKLRVKICGLSDAASARVAVAAGADALGFILAPSRRQVAPERIRDIRSELLSSNEVLPPMVGVVVNATPNEIALAVAISGVDMIQLSGEETPDILESIDVPVIKAVRFADGTTLEDARRVVGAWLDRPRPAHWVLVEGHAPGSHGGTGTVADWDQVSRIASGYPVWLAGGLSPDNVADAIALVRPQGVDVSSGVEVGGVKDAARIRAFLGEAHCPGISSS
jgi:phosphoribosylanthranilate isomerase